jgi:ATP-dependent Clp protease ATP-binding subunit ClpC
MPSTVRNLTERSRALVELARHAAARLGQSRVSAAHLLLGIIHEGEGVAVTALRFHGVALDDLSARVTTLAESAGASEPDADAILAVARKEADAIGHPYVGTEHLLLALLSDRESPVAKELARRGMSYDDARARVMWILSGDPHHPEAFASPPVT